MHKERIQKILSQQGFGSRRSIEALITDGKIYVDGKLATLGCKVHSGSQIQINGKKIYLKDNAEENDVTRVILYNKPAGEVCTRKDEEGRLTVFKHLPKLHKQRWVAVGRLDLNTSGLLLFTTDGKLANTLMHPSSNIEREYAVRVLGNISADSLKILSAGVKLEDGMAKFDKIWLAGNNQDSANKWYHVIIKEGRNREVKRLFSFVGNTVSRLIRVRFGNIKLPISLRAGKYIDLSPKEIKQLIAAYQKD